MDKELDYSVLAHLADLSDTDNPNDWNLELNIIKWGNNKPKLDLRKWKINTGDGKKRMSKGITLTCDEFLKLLKVKPEIVKQSLEEEK